MTEVEQKAAMLKNTSLDVVNQCFNVWQAENFVKVNYVVVNIDFQDFVENEYSQDEAVSLATVIGTVGGNLGKLDILVPKVRYFRAALADTCIQLVCELDILMRPSKMYSVILNWIQYPLQDSWAVTIFFAGLFMGFSIMTIIEWFEMFFFFVMGIPVFLTAGKLNIFWMFVRKEDDDGGTSVMFVNRLAWVFLSL